MQQQQNMYVPASAANNTGSVRTGQQAGAAVYRGPPGATGAPPPQQQQQPRNSGARQLPMQTMFPQMQQSVVLPTYPPHFAQRQPTFQHQQYSYAAQPFQHNFFPYQYYAMPQPQTHQRAGVAVNAAGVGVGVNVGNAMQTAAPVSTQTQMPLAGQVITGAVPAGASAMLAGVAGNAAAPTQVAVSSLMSVLPPGAGAVPTQTATHTTTQSSSRKLRRFALDIIDPATNRNIMEDIVTSKNSSSSTTAANDEFTSESASSLPLTTTTVQHDICNLYANQNQDHNVIVMTTDPKTMLPYNIVPPTQSISQAIVTEADAMIEPKVKSKKIPIVSPKDYAILQNENMQINAETLANNKNENLAEYQQGTNTENTTGATTTTSVPAQMLQDLSFVNNSSSSSSSKDVPMPQNDENQTQILNENDIKQNDDKLRQIATATATTGAAAAAETTTTLETVVIAHSNEHVDNAVHATSDTNKTTQERNSDEETAIVVKQQQQQQNIRAENIVEKQQQQQPARALTPPPTAITTATQAAEQQTQLPAAASQIEVTAAKLEPQTTCDETDRIITEPISLTAQQTTVAIEEQQQQQKDNAATQLIDTETILDVNAEIDSTEINDETTNTAMPTPTPTSDSSSSIINYNEGQWSPNNPTGKKQYDRNQLLLLREAKASRIQPEVNNAAILPTINLMPSFMRHNQSNNNQKRIQSMGGGGGSMSGSRADANGMSASGGGSGNQFKQSSMSGVHARNSMKLEMIHVNLSLNQDVKLNETDNAWRPRVLGKVGANNTESIAADSDEELRAKREKDELIRRVRGILNKLTPEKFDTLVEEIIKLKIDTPDKMEEVMVLVFEKAIDEPNFSVSYARLCHRLVSEVKARDERMESGTKSNLAQFRNALLDKTEREFTQNVTQPTAKEEKLKPILDKIKKSNDPAEKAELQALLEEEERKIRRRSTGTVRFIGELFKISMLTGKIINSCIDALLKFKSEDMLECLCKLLTTVGAKYEQTPLNNKEPKTCYSLDKQIAKMQAIASKTDKDGAKISSRVRFMLQDVIDLRKNNWQSSRNEVPKTMEQIEKETKTEQLSSQYLNYSAGGGGASNAGGNAGNSSSQNAGTAGGGGGKQNERMARYGDVRSSSNYGGSNSQRGGAGGGNDTGSLRRQKQANDRAGGGGGGGSNNSGVSNNANSQQSNSVNNDDSTWQVQTGRGNRYLTVDANKLEGLQQNLDMPKKMGNVSQFVWNNTAQRQQASSVGATTTLTNSFAALSALDRDRDRDRDRSGTGRGGGGGKSVTASSYNKGSMERDRYVADRMGGGRTGSSHASRENSTSRGNATQTMRSSGTGGSGQMSASMQKTASQTKYSQNIQQQQQQTSRINTKSSAAVGSTTNNNNNNSGYANQQYATTTTDNATTKSTTATAAPKAVFELASDADIKIIRSVITEMIEQAATSKCIDASVVSCFSKIKDNKRCAFLFYILNEYLHLRDVGAVQRRQLANIVIYLIQHNYLSVEHIRLAYDNFSKEASDLIYDIPDLWLYVFEFAGPLIVNKIISIQDLWTNDLKAESSPSFAQKFLKSYLLYCTREVGPCFTRNMWKKFNMKWTDFMPQDKVADFITANHLQFIENESATPKIEIKCSKEKHISRVMEHIESLLREGTSTDGIIDYINGNIVEVDKLFIRSLTTTLCNFAIIFKDYKLDVEKFQKICIPILHRYIDSREERDLECLYAMQLLSHSLEHPRGLLTELFAELYDGDLVPQESFLKWRDSKDQSAGKGVAVKGLNQFFNHLQSSDTSDENN